jgi:uncharacterized membrane protein
MRNKKWKLTIIALIYLFCLSAFFCVLMALELIKNNSFAVTNWVGLWLAVFGALFSILGTFGVANSYDKRTIIKKTQEDLDNNKVGCVDNEGN